MPLDFITDFSETNPVIVGKPTKKSEYDRLDINIKAVRDGVIAKQLISIDGSRFGPFPSPSGCGPFQRYEMSSGRYVWGCPFRGDTTDQYASFVLHMADRWNLLTVEYHVRWFNIAGGSGSPRFSLAGVAFGDGDSMDAAAGTAVIVTDAAQAAEACARSAISGALTIAGTPARADSVRFDFGRTGTHASDTYDAKDAIVMGLDLYVGILKPNDA